MKKIAMWFITLCIGVSLCACTQSLPEETKVETSLPSGQSTEPSAEVQTEASTEAPTAPATEVATEISEEIEESTAEAITEVPTEAAYQPSEREIQMYLNTWEVFNQEKYITCRLILSENALAQYIVQDRIGNLVHLYGGTWTITGKNQISLQLTQSMRDGEELQKPVATESCYQMVKGPLSRMTLTYLDGTILLPQNPMDLYDERFTPQRLDEVCQAVRAYYKTVNGEEYPGKVIVNDTGPDGALIQLTEDMGDHMATAGWYLINPITLMGSDEGMGTDIDFGAYLYS